MEHSDFESMRHAEKVVPLPDDGTPEHAAACARYYRTIREWKLVEFNRHVELIRRLRAGPLPAAFVEELQRDARSAVADGAERHAPQLTRFAERVALEAECDGSASQAFQLFRAFGIDNNRSRTRAALVLALILLLGLGLGFGLAYYQQRLPFFARPSHSVLCPVDAGLRVHGLSAGEQAFADDLDRVRATLGTDPGPEHRGRDGEHHVVRTDFDCFHLLVPPPAKFCGFSGGRGSRILSAYHTMQTRGA